MKIRRFAWVIALVLLGVVWWLVARARQDRLGGSSPQPGSSPSAPPAEGGVRDQRPVSNRASGKEDIPRLLSRAVDVMRRGNQADTDDMLGQLDEMLAPWRNDPETAIAAILAFLRTGQDASTGRGFVIGQGGILAEATTLRVYLMDKLGVLSRKVDGGQALTAARETLQDFGSADEWAVSMRNIAWFDPASRGFLQDRVNAMIRHPGWLAQPTTGMLEAFDIIVHTGAMTAVTELNRFISDPASPLARASGVALDRLATLHAMELTAFLNQQPELLAAAPLMRADLFARADLRDPGQRQQLETYLLRGDVEASERRKFFGSLVQSGRFVSHNLVTPYIPPETPAQAGSRLETLTRTVYEWMRDGRFKALEGELATLGTTVNRIIDEIEAESE